MTKCNRIVFKEIFKSANFKEILTIVLWWLFIPDKLSLLFDSLNSEMTWKASYKKSKEYN